MHILISNDDGYMAPGINALANEMRRFGRVSIVAPEHNHSGSSNALTLNKPLTVTNASEDVFVVSGTPSDCVHLALTGLLDDRPDLVVSGINCGANMGDDTMYSGTVAAAIEGLHCVQPDRQGLGGTAVGCGHGRKNRRAFPCPPGKGSRRTDFAQCQYA